MTRRHFTWSLVVAAACLIFILDSVTPADICASVLYVTIIMIVLRTGSVRDLVAAGIGCVLLTTVSLFLIPGGPLRDRVALIDYALSVFALVSTSYLGIRVLMGEQAARRTQEGVAKISRGVSLSELTTSIAHEINQPLAAIVANAAAAKRWLAASPPNLVEASNAVAAIASSGERGGAIINGLKRLISTSTLRRQNFDVSQLISETIELLRLDIARSRAEVEIHASKRLSTFVGDPILLQQTIMNLISNSLEALQDVGPGQRLILIDVAERKDVWILQIKDTGLGVDPTAFDQLFQPFYSTKTSGMGIGLAICRSIVEAHGGSITARPNEPRGMIFELRIPRLATREGGEP